MNKEPGFVDCQSSEIHYWIDQKENFLPKSGFDWICDGLNVRWSKTLVSDVSYELRDSSPFSPARGEYSLAGVYEVIDQTGKLYILKILSKYYQNVPEAKRVFENEIDLYEKGKKSGNNLFPEIVKKDLNHKQASFLMEKLPNDILVLPDNEVFLKSFLQRIIATLVFAKNLGIFHGAICPKNIMGTPEMPYLIGFHQGKKQLNISIEQSEEFFQLKGLAIPIEQRDIISLGLSMYFLVKGEDHPLFEKIIDYQSNSFFPLGRRIYFLRKIFYYKLKKIVNIKHKMDKIIENMISGKYATFEEVESAFISYSLYDSPLKRSP